MPADKIASGQKIMDFNSRCVIMNTKPDVV